MSSELLASKIVVQEEEPQTRQVTPVATAVLAIVGVTERGPHARTLVSSPEEFQNLYGGYTANGKTKQALDGYWTNGGVQAYVKRAVHYTNTSVPATKQSVAATLNLLTAASAPFAAVATGTLALGTLAIASGGTFLVGVDTNPDDTATFDSAAAVVTGATTETFALSDGLTLTFDTQSSSESATFNTAEFSAIGAATALEVAAVINAECVGVQADVNAGAVRLTTDQKGTGASLGTFGGTALALLGFTGLSDTGTGDVANAAAVTFAEIKTVLEADLISGSGVTVTQNGSNFPVITSNTTGAGSEIQAVAGTIQAALGFDLAAHAGGTGAAQNTLQVDAKTDGSYGNDLRVVIAASTSGDTDKVNFSVEEDGVVVEVFPNVSLTDGDDDYIETIVNATDSTGSNLVAVTDLDAAAPSPGDLPTTGTFGPLTGGDDGLTSLDDNDFVGAAAGETGFRGFDDVQELTLLVCPDRPTAAVQNAMITYCETTRGKQMFAVLDPPLASDAAAIVTYVETTAALLGASEFGAMYWPQILALNPNKTVFGTGTNITVPPSGHIAGVYARTDAARPSGVFTPPAGIEAGKLLGITGFETDEVKKEEKRDLVFPKRINPLTVFPGAPRHIDGARTLKSNGNFPSVSERRGAIFVEQSVKNGLQFARHKNNTESLRATVDRTTTQFLLTQMNNGAFRSRNPATAFFVDFGDGLNTTSVQFAGKLIGRIGIATNKPTEFIILRFSQDTRALDEEIAAAQ